MTVNILAPRSLAAAPLVLMAYLLPEKYQLAFFTDHDAALASLKMREADILCTGFTEPSRLAAGADLQRIATFVWGLSSVLVHDKQIRDFHSLVNDEQQKLLLPFARSPVDLQVRALVKKMAPINHAELMNTAGTEMITRFLQGGAAAAVLPEPMATQLCEGGKAHRLAELSEVWNEQFAEKLTPQVSCFCTAGLEKREIFRADLQAAIADIEAGGAGIAQLVGAPVGQSVEAIQRALPHVIFSLPQKAEAQRLEKAYSKILDSL